MIVAHGKHSTFCWRWGKACEGWGPKLSLKHGTKIKKGSRWGYEKRGSKYSGQRPSDQKLRCTSRPFVLGAQWEGLMGKLQDSSVIRYHCEVMESRVSSLLDSRGHPSLSPGMLSHTHKKSSFWGNQHSDTAVQLVNTCSLWLLNQVKWPRSGAFLNGAYTELLHLTPSLIFSQGKNLG